jgi:hypothetical protein
VLAALGAAALSSGCSLFGAASACADLPGTVAVTVASRGATHLFCAELADTADEQAQGLKFRTDLKPDGGMLFAPYPAEGGGAREAGFWMKDTPTSLDILFVRADGSIARVAADTVPFSEDIVPSGEPVAAVLEIVGGRAAALGIAAGDKVSWARPRG